MCVGYTASKLSDVMSAGLGWSIGPDMEGDGGSERRIGADDEQIRGLTGIVRQMQDKYRNLAYAFWVRFSLCQHIISQRESQFVPTLHGQFSLRLFTFRLRNYLSINPFCP